MQILEKETYNIESKVKMKDTGYYYRQQLGKG